MPTIIYNRNRSIELLNEAKLDFKDLREGNIREVVKKLINWYFLDSISDYELSGTLDYLLYEVEAVDIVDDLDLIRLMEGMRRFYRMVKIQAGDQIITILDRMRKFIGDRIEDL